MTDNRGRTVEYVKDGSFYHPVLPKKWVTYEMKEFWEFG